MALYAVIHSRPIGETEVIWRKRADSARYWAHAAIYDAFDAQGIRDSRAAWNALKRLYDAGSLHDLPRDSAGQRKLFIPCGDQHIVTVTRLA